VNLLRLINDLNGPHASTVRRPPGGTSHVFMFKCKLFNFNFKVSTLRPGAAAEPRPGLELGQ
jgi:hypothetical protein